MVATDQEKEKGFIEGLLAKLAEDDTPAKIGAAASMYANQPMSQQVMPIQYGGGLLQMMPTPQMQTGQGIMGFQPPDVGGNVEKSAKLIKALQAMLGMG